MESMHLESIVAIEHMKTDNGIPFDFMLGNF